MGQEQLDAMGIDPPNKPAVVSREELETTPDVEAGWTRDIRVAYAGFYSLDLGDVIQNRGCFQVALPQRSIQRVDERLRLTDRAFKIICRSRESDDELKFTYRWIELEDSHYPYLHYIGRDAVVKCADSEEL